jgi:hypothetical protein
MLKRKKLASKILASKVLNYLETTEEEKNITILTPS